MKKVIPFILLIAAFFLVFSGDCLAAGNEALILVDEQTAAGPDPSAAATLADLLGHFDIPSEIRQIDGYTSGDIDAHRVTFYIGSVWDKSLSQEFLTDVITTDSRVVWINYNLWRLGWSGYQGAFESRFGFNYDQTTLTGNFNKVAYSGRNFTRSQDDFTQVAVLDPGLNFTIGSITNGNRNHPYIIRSGDFFFVADNPLTQHAEDSDYLVFGEALHEMVGVPHSVGHKALVRIEDVNPSDDPAAIRAIADYLYSQNVPFSIGVTPRFADPLGAWGPPGNIDLADRPALVSALNYAVSKGATIIMHGYTHQYDSIANPTNGVTGVDCEFYLEHLDTFGNIVFGGAVPEDSAAWAQGRVDSSAALFAQAGLPRPGIWETPHYLASDVDYQVFSDDFGILYERFANTHFPYVINRTVYGSRLIPENLGYLSPGIITPQTIINRADRYLAIRDGVASFFFHPEVDISLLQSTVSGIKAKGFTFVDVNSLTATDENPPWVSSVKPAGNIDTASATIDIAYSDPGSGVNPATVSVTLDGAALGSCVTGASGTVCSANGLTLGQHSIGGALADNAGNASVISGNFTVVDRAPPEVTFTGPGVIDSANTELTATFTDAEPSSGIDEGSAVLSIDDGGDIACSVADGAIACPVTDLGDGVHHAQLRISDHAGNQGSASRDFVVDTVAPALSGAGPAGWVTTSSPQITADIFESGSGLPAVPAEVTIDAGAPQPCVVSGSLLSCDAGGLSQGEHTYTVTARDIAGNEGSVNGSFSVDSIAPVIANMSPAGTITSGSPVIAADFIERGSGVDLGTATAGLDGNSLAGDWSVNGMTGAAYWLSDGAHGLTITLADIAGNQTSASWAFTVSCGPAPPVGVSATRSRWASYLDYVEGRLSVEFELANAASYAVDAEIRGVATSGGVTLLSKPEGLFNIKAGSTTVVVMTFDVPDDVAAFRNVLYARVEDPSNGCAFFYPGSSGPSA